MLPTGNFNRIKKFRLEVNENDSSLFVCSRNQFVPFEVKKYVFGWKRKKQLAKALLVDIVSNKWLSNKDAVDFILGEGLIHKLELLALVSTFNKEEYEKNKE